MKLDPRLNTGAGAVQAPPAERTTRIGNRKRAGIGTPSARKWPARKTMDCTRTADADFVSIPEASNFPGDAPLEQDFLLLLTAGLALPDSGLTKKPTGITNAECAARVPNRRRQLTWSMVRAVTTPVRLALGGYPRHAHGTRRQPNPPLNHPGHGPVQLPSPGGGWRCGHAVSCSRQDQQRPGFHESNLTMGRELLIPTDRAEFHSPVQHTCCGRSSPRYFVCESTVATSDVKRMIRSPPVVLRNSFPNCKGGVGLNGCSESFFAPVLELEAEWR